MSRIAVSALHHTDRETAQESADELAADLAKKFNIDYGWDGDTICFERTGVNGTITIDDQLIEIHAELGLLLSFLQSRIEEEIQTYLVDHLGCTLQPEE